MTSAANTHIGQRPAGDTTITGKGANPQAATTGGMSASRAATTVQFAETEFDFGKMKQGDQVEHIFKFTNTGNEPLIIEDAKDKDNVMSFGDVKVLVDPKSSIYLKGITLDYQDGLNGKGFVFENPSAKNTCGCGESFSV
jgi:Fe-S cluster assembly iron-binding protein IscA